MWYFIETHKFDIDYYKEPLQRMTLLHVIAKHHTDNYTDEDKQHILKLIHNSNNLLLKNNFGRTIITLAVSIQGKEAENVKFLKEQMEIWIKKKMLIMADIIHKALNKKAEDSE